MKVRRPARLSRAFISWGSGYTGKHTAKMAVFTTERSLLSGPGCSSEYAPPFGTSYSPYRRQKEACRYAAARSSSQCIAEKTYGHPGTTESSRPSWRLHPSE